MFLAPLGLIVGFAVLTVFSCFIGSTHAAPFGYTLRIGPTPGILDPFDEPRISLDNDSTNVKIVDFMMTIGDTDFNFDWAVGESFSGIGGFTSSLITPDTNGSGGVRSDETHYTFTGFSAGETFSFKTDIDQDSINNDNYYRFIFFDVGGSDAGDNSLITVQFSDGTILSGQLPDYPSFQNGYVFSQFVPEPSTLILAVLGLLGLGWYGWRRRRRIGHVL